MRGAGIFFIAASAVLYVANWAHIGAHGDISFTALILGTMSFGAGVALLIAHSNRKR